MNPHEYEVEESIFHSGDNIVFPTLTDSGTIAGLNSCITTANPTTLIFKPVIHYQRIVELIENIGFPSQESESNAQWLKLAESAFKFWDNDSDSKYDLL